MDEVDRRIVDCLQDGLPLCPAPYAAAAAQLGMTEAELLQRLRDLLDAGILTRFGPLYHAERIGGSLTLAALQVPEDRFAEVASLVNGFAEVAHNYRRTHALNMWFVVATDRPERRQQVLAAIAAQTGLKVYDMPKIAEYFVNLKLSA